MGPLERFAPYVRLSVRLNSVSHTYAAVKIFKKKKFLYHVEYSNLCNISVYLNAYKSFVKILTMWVYSIRY